MSEPDIGPRENGINQYIQIRSERSRRLRVLLLAFLFMLSITLLLFVNDDIYIPSGDHKYISLSLILRITSLSSFLAFFSILAMSYLQYGFRDLLYTESRTPKPIEFRFQSTAYDKRQSRYSTHNSDIEALLSDISQLKDRIELIETAPVKMYYENVELVAQELKDRVLEEGGIELLRRAEESISRSAEELTEKVLSDGGDALLQRAENVLALKLQSIKGIQVINDTFEESKERLSFEISRLERKGNFNLILGGITTILGIGLLGYAVFFRQNTASSIEEFAIAFAPRLSVVILLQVFSFFFLKLYRANLSDVKYFQNEITNVEHRQIAINAASEHAKDSQWTDLLLTLVKTERNRVLEKGQTTIDIEHARIESHIGVAEVLTKLTPLLKK